MKRLNLNMAIVCGLAVVLSGFNGTEQSRASAAGVAQKGGGGRGGGGGGHAGGVGGGHVNGGGGAVHAGGGFRGNGGIHAPAAGGPRISTGHPHVNSGGVVRENNGGGGIRINGGAYGQGHIPAPNRTPSLSHPNPGSIRSAITHNPALNNRLNGGALIGGGRNGNGPTVGIGSKSHINAVHNGVNGLNNLHAGSNLNSNLNRLAGITNRQYNGNSLNFNNRRIPLANNLYRPAYYRHSNYYHGYWNGNRGSNFTNSLAYGLGTRLAYSLGSNIGNGWGLGNNYGYGGYRRGYGYGGRSPYGFRPLGWGLGGWGLGSLAYNSGYLGYSNPYYATGGWSGYNYSQPIQVSYTTPVTVVDNTSTSQGSPASQDSTLDAAVAAFRNNDYDAALDIVNKGIVQSPDDAVLHEFRALVLFAKQDYQQAAATIHSVLAVGPGWDWTTLSGMYSNVDLYTTQLRALESFTKSNPNDAPSEFLLAYHYLSCGHTDAAIRHLQQVVTLMPNDRVAADILQMLQPPTVDDAKAAANAPPVAAETELPPIIPVDPKTLVGNWKASRPDGSTFSLNMTDDSKFTWSFAVKGQPAQEFGGTYSVEENVLALERKDGGSLVAEVTSDNNGNFNFRMLGAPEEDLGLDFSK